MKEEIKTEILNTQTCHKPIKNALDYLFELLRTNKKCPFFMVFNSLHLLRKLFWVDLGGSLPLRPISIMDLGYCVQMNP